MEPALLLELLLLKFHVVLCSISIHSSKTPQKCGLTFTHYHFCRHQDTDIHKPLPLQAKKRTSGRSGNRLIAIRVIRSVSAIKSDIILDHDDIVGDIQEKNAQYYQLIGVLAGDGFSDQTNSRMGIGVEAIHVLNLIQLLRSVGVQNPVLQ